MKGEYVIDANSSIHSDKEKNNQIDKSELINHSNNTHTFESIVKLKQQITNTII